MPSSRTFITTENGSKYLQQLCKHWSHKLNVEFTPEQGKIAFDGGRLCRLASETGGLHLTVEAPDDATLTRTEGVVIEHLKRFAFRENLDPIVWKPAEAG